MTLMEIIKIMIMIITNDIETGNHWMNIGV